MKTLLTWREEQGLSRYRIAADTGISDQELKRVEDREVDPRSSTVAILLGYAAARGGGLTIEGLLSDEALERVLNSRTDLAERESIGADAQ